MQKSTLILKFCAVAYTAYDIYYCIRNYPGGPEQLAEACRSLLEHAVLPLTEN
jgi:hypothetical protein